MGVAVMVAALWVLAVEAQAPTAVVQVPMAVGQGHMAVVRVPTVAVLEEAMPVVQLAELDRVRIALHVA
jgi:hypothetical protein